MVSASAALTLPAAIMRQVRLPIRNNGRAARPLQALVPQLRRLPPQHDLYFLNTVGWRAAMDDGAAVGANRPQVRDGVDLVPRADVGQLPQMVDVDVAHA